jgi:flagellar biosynthetic protein FlhB
MSGDRTERASPRKRQQAAEKGDRVHSRELVSAAAMLCGVLALGALAEKWTGQWSLVYQSFLAMGKPHVWEGGGEVKMVIAIRQMSMVMLMPLALMFAAVAAAALFASVGQSRGVTFNAEALQWKWQRINAVENLKNLASLRGLARLVKSLVPAAILSVFAIRRIIEQAAVPPLGAEQMPGMLRAAYAILLDTAWILFAWSAVDYLVEWRSWESRQRMSKQELREEQKQTEGSPQIRGKIKSLRRQMRRRLLKADISRASVVITNPAHYAVALSFSFETMEPPRMIAKGRDLLAAQIKEEARWAGIPIVENPPLARSLYRHLEPGQSIPYDLYAAVAAILAYLYRQQVEERLRRERGRGSAARTDRPAVAPGGMPWAPDSGEPKSAAGKDAAQRSGLRESQEHT